MPYAYCSLPNLKGKGHVEELISDDPDEIAYFIKTWDVPGRGVYYCPNRLKEGATRRCIETIECIENIFADIDYRDLDTEPAAIENKLLHLPVEPSVVNGSGRGLHPYWRLKEPAYANDSEMFVRAMRLQKELAARLSADPLPTHPAALMRVVGTHNSKVEGEAVVVSELWGSGNEVDITELEEMLDSLPTEGAFKRKDNGNGHDKDATVIYPEQWRPPVDVEQRLSDMRFEGPGDSSIHNTQLSCTASLLCTGHTIEEATSIVLEATRRAVANNERAANWKWAKEEIDIWKMCADFVVEKKPELIDLLPKELREPVAVARAAGKHPRVFYNTLVGKFHVRSYESTAKTDEQKSPKEKEKPARVTLRPFTPINPASLPPRQFLYGKQYQRGVVSATVAPGGTGKTSLVMVEAIAMATARNLLGEQPEERCRVWLHNGEDCREELERRVVAVCQHYGIPQEELEGWLFLTSGTEMALKVANGYSDLKIDGGLVEEMTIRVSEHEIDVVMFDPLVTLHNVNESDNSKMDALIRIFTRMADVCGCAIDISHHTRKMPAGSTFDHVADDARGASSIRDAVRMLRVLNVMSRDEAKELNMDEFERLSYFRVDRGKANTVAPANNATWRKFISVSLVNGDDVGVITAWDHPASSREGSKEKATKDHVADTVFLTLLDKFEDSGREVSDRTGARFAPALFAEEKEAKSAKLGNAHFRAAMQRLFDAKTIRCEAYGRTDRPSHRIKRT